MWSKTNRPGRAWVGVFVSLLLVSAPEWLYGQSNNQNNSQLIIIKPEEPPGPGSLAPNPRPPEPPKIDAYQVTPPKPDDDNIPSGGGTSLPKNPRSGKTIKLPPRIPAEPDDPSGNVEEDKSFVDSKTDNPESSSLIPSDKGTLSKPNQSLEKMQKRVQSMQSRLLDAPRATFSLQQAERNTSLPRVTKTEFEPAQVLFGVNGLEEAKQIQSTLAAEGFRVRSRRVFSLLDMVVLNLRTPKGVIAQNAKLELETRFPNAIVELNHRYSILEQSDKKAYAGKLIRWQPADLRCLSETRIGMIDTAVASEHPTLVGSKLELASVLIGGSKPAPGNHGTGIAAILVSTGSDGYAKGVASSAALISVEAFREDPQGKIDTTTELVIAAMELLLDKQVVVMNLSFGGPQNKLLALALEAVMNRNVSIIAAAGNQRSAKVVYPAAYEGVIAVTAVDANGAQMKDVTKASYIDFAAPGVDVWTAAANGRGKYVSGTSFAVPYVSALVSILRQQNPGLERKQIYQRLKQQSVDLGASGKDNSFGWGLISWPGICKASH